ncbi:MAG: hypothetical protein GY696_15635 [Gammaproteobacteria bacterium]|nr:hypothetical protein [Gammaproteobacteria bacterium]
MVKPASSAVSGVISPPPGFEGKPEYAAEMHKQLGDMQVSHASTIKWKQGAPPIMATLRDRFESGVLAGPSTSIAPAAKGTTHAHPHGPKDIPNWKVERVMFPEGEVSNDTEGYNLDFGQVMVFHRDYGWVLINQDSTVNRQDSLMRLGDRFFPLPRRYITFSEKVAYGFLAFYHQHIEDTGKDMDPNDFPHLWWVEGNEVQELDAPWSSQPSATPSLMSSHSFTIPDLDCHSTDVNILQAQLTTAITSINTLQRENAELTSAITSLQSAKTDMRQANANLRGYASIARGIMENPPPVIMPPPKASGSSSDSSAMGASDPAIVASTAQTSQVPASQMLSSTAFQGNAPQQFPALVAPNPASLQAKTPLVAPAGSRPNVLTGPPVRDASASASGSAGVFLGQGHHTPDRASSLFQLTRPAKLQLGHSASASYGPPRPSDFVNTRMPKPEGTPYICRVYYFDSQMDGRLATADFARFPKDLISKFKGPRDAYVSRIMDDQQCIVRFPGQEYTPMRSTMGLFRLSGHSEEAIWKGMVASYSHLNRIRIEWEKAGGNSTVSCLAIDLETAFTKLCEIIQAGNFTPGPNKGMPWVPFF